MTTHQRTSSAGPSTSGCPVRRHSSIAPFANFVFLSSLLTATLLLLLLLSFAVSATTGHPRVIRNDTIFNKRGSPYIFQEDLYIAHKARLIIEPGVELRFDHNKGILVKGTLHAEVSFIDTLSIPCICSVSDSSSVMSHQ